MLHWECGVPGKEDGDWKGGTFPVEIRFAEDFPAVPPRCFFMTRPLPPHHNVFENGEICLSLVRKAWKPTISLKEILLGIQELLDDANPRVYANLPMYEYKKKNPEGYAKAVREFVEKYKTPEVL